MVDILKVVTGIVIGLLIGFYLLFPTTPQLIYVGRTGDMNDDMVLNITDLSILAAVINEQR